MVLLDRDRGWGQSSQSQFFLLSCFSASGFLLCCSFPSVQIWDRQLCPRWMVLLDHHRGWGQSSQSQFFLLSRFSASGFRLCCSFTSVQIWDRQLCPRWIVLSDHHRGWGQSSQSQFFCFRAFLLPASCFAALFPLYKFGTDSSVHVGWFYWIGIAGGDRVVCPNFSAFVLFCFRLPASGFRLPALLLFFLCANLGQTALSTLDGSIGSGSRVGTE